MVRFFFHSTSADCQECGSYVQNVFSLVPSSLATFSLLLIIVFQVNQTVRGKKGEIQFFRWLKGVFVRVVVDVWTPMKKCKMVSVFTSGYVNTETILHFFYKITNERGTKIMFTCAHVKWFYGQSERAYYLNYFIKNHVIKAHFLRRRK